MGPLVKIYGHISMHGPEGPRIKGIPGHDLMTQCLGNLQALINAFSSSSCSIRDTLAERPMNALELNVVKDPKSYQSSFAKH